LTSCAPGCAHTLLIWVFVSLTHSKHMASLSCSSRFPHNCPGIGAMRFFYPQDLLWLGVLLLWNQGLCHMQGWSNISLNFLFLFRKTGLQLSWGTSWVTQCSCMFLYVYI
jgi:hypothetical protein